jgi:hypothetical protein
VWFAESGGGFGCVFVSAFVSAFGSLRCARESMKTSPCAAWICGVSAALLHKFSPFPLKALVSSVGVGMFFVAPPRLAFLLDCWEAFGVLCLPFFAFEQERVVVVSKKAPAETPAAHLSFFSIFVAVV